MVGTWKRLYPSVDVDQQLRNIEGWLDGNPAKRKTLGGMKKFINKWLSDEQNKGARASMGANYGRGNGGGAGSNPGAPEMSSLAQVDQMSMFGGVAA